MCQNRLLFSLLQVKQNWVGFKNSMLGSHFFFLFTTLLLFFSLVKPLWWIFFTFSCLFDFTTLLYTYFATVFREFFLFFQVRIFFETVTCTTFCFELNWLTTLVYRGFKNFEWVITTSSLFQWKPTNNKASMISTIYAYLPCLIRQGFWKLFRLMFSLKIVIPVAWIPLELAGWHP